MVKKQKKDKNNTPDPSLLVVEPTIQYVSGETDNEKVANMGKKKGGK
ncbi:MAG: hypothetical protein ACOY46_17310 [Bacillota bacterium]